MAKASDNLFPKVLLDTQASNPSAPSGGTWKMYAKANGIFAVGSNNTPVGPFGAASSGTAAFVGCVARRTTDQTGIGSGSGASVLLTGTDLIDTDGFHDPASNSQRITIPSGKDGKYRFTAMVLWEANATGMRQLAMTLTKSGPTVTTLAVHSHPTSAGGEFTYQSLTSVPVDLVAGDYVELSVYQNSGGNRSLLGASVPLVFSCEFLGT